MSSTKFLLSKFSEEITHFFVTEIDFSVSGLFIVDVPDGVQLDTPTDYLDLKTKKSDGFISLFPDYPNIEYNELDNDSAVDVSAIGHRAHIGNFEWMLKANESTIDGSIITNPVLLTGTPYDYIPFWSVYELEKSIGDANVLQSSYIEHDPTDLLVDVSMDGGLNWDAVAYQTPLIPSVPGSSMVWRFKNTCATNLYLGYYALVWRP